MKLSDITIVDVSIEFHPYDFRVPLKFGGLVLEKVTDLNVTVCVRDRAGNEMEGFGSMPMSNIWAFPSRVLSYDDTLGAMKALADEICAIHSDYDEFADPIAINAVLEPRMMQAAENVTQHRQLSEPIPPLCTLVVASPFDAAIHDAFGKLLGRNCFSAYGADTMNHDIAHYLDDRFVGEYLDRYVQPKAKPTIPLFHLVGALDPLTDADIANRLNDGLPETLPEWIRADGLTHLKIKLNGDNLEWDINRVISVDRIAEETQKERGVGEWCYSLDFNERCESVEYFLEFLHQIRERAPKAEARTLYIEQPTARDLKAHPENKMHKAAEIKPVVIDESLVDFESFQLAQEQGYSGVALKACKGQSQALLMGAAAQKFDMFLCVQDLTCPGASFLHSLSLSAHIPAVQAIEGNSRQYCPGANDGWRGRFPDAFTVREGNVSASALDGPGLGIVP